MPATRFATPSSVFAEPMRRSARYAEVKTQWVVGRLVRLTLAIRDAGGGPIEGHRLSPSIN